jgi:dephospho-CoA kinase
MMKKIKLIGLTGGAATGKTTAARMFARLGVPVIDTDRLAHDVIKRGTPQFKGIVKMCGTGILKKGDIDRSRLAEIIFSGRGSAIKRRIERMIHPAVWKRAQEMVKGFEKRGYKTVIIEAPLLFEAKWDKRMNVVITVFCDVKEQKRRCPARFRQRIDLQWSINKKAQLADFVIDNSGNRKETARQVRVLFERLTS